MTDTITYVPREVAGKLSPSKLLHRKDCPHLRDVGWPEPVLIPATDEQRRLRRKCLTCLAAEAREAGR